MLHWPPPSKTTSSTARLRRLAWRRPSSSGWCLSLAFVAISEGFALATPCVLRGSKSDW